MLISDFISFFGVHPESVAGDDVLYRGEFFTVGAVDGDWVHLYSLTLSA